MICSTCFITDPYLATLHKQGDNLFHALTLTFQGKPLNLDSIERNFCDLWGT